MRPAPGRTTPYRCRLTFNAALSAAITLEAAMPDDVSKKGPADKTKVNVNESWELKYWTKTLNVAEEKLKAAVKAVGTRVEDIRKHLSGK